jgi:aspartyl protease family protein
MQIGRIAVDHVQALVLEDGLLKDTLVGMSFLNRLEKFQIADGSLLLSQ